MLSAKNKLSSSMKADEGELVDRLAAIGLDEREARLYVHLLLTGPSRASDSAAASRLKRTETYRALEGLMRRGFVTAHLTRPVVYEAVAPGSVFANLLADHEVRRDEMEQLREHVAAIAHQARVAEQAAEAARHSYKIIQGRRPILSTAETMVRGARESIAYSTGLLTAGQLAQNRGLHAIARRGEEGRAVRLLLVETPGIERTLLAFSRHPHVEIRYAANAHAPRLMLADKRDAVAWLVSDPDPGVDGRGDVAMWTNAPEFVRGQDALFEALWAGARVAPKQLL